jgi:hypothetical protein
MTPRPLARFWKSLDDVPNATTNRWEWSLRLKDDLPKVEWYLAATGRRAKEIACPSPGGDGCPRKIVKHSDGRFRAVCGNKPAECDAIEVTGEEIACLALDRKKLAAAVCTILSATSESGFQERGAVMLVGSHAVAAGVGIPIVLMIPGPMAEVSVEILPELDAPAAFVMPTTSSISHRLKTTLKSRGHCFLALSEISGLDDQHRLVGLQSADELLSPIREKLLASQASAVSGRIWLLPADARWEEMVFEFTAADALNIRFRGETRSFDAQQLDMKRKRTGKATSQWALLQSFAENDGEISWSSAVAHPKVKKQKQLLSDKLIKTFGIADDPISWDKRSNAYRTKFKISGTPLGFRHAQSARR